MRSDGPTAPAVVDGQLDNLSIQSYVEQVLVPTLRPGDRVVLDDLVICKQATARTSIEAAGTTTHFLPPYSPDPNSVELVFAKLKAYLRKTRPTPSTNRSGSRSAGER